MQKNSNFRLEQRKEYKSGWRNNYRDTMPVMEAWSKDVKFAVSDGIQWIRNGFKLPVIFVYPDFPSKKTTIYKIAKSLGYRLTNKEISNPDLVVYFEDITHGSSAQLTARYKNVINSACTDISKRKVDEVHLSVFGYNTFIDPKTFVGKAVQKSDTNALHDGKIIDCPQQTADESSVYQLVIDNEFDAAFVVDFRVPVMRGMIPHVYKKFKDKSVRFTNDVTKSELHETSSLFSADEQKRIAAFASAMGADFCELDVLKHNADGRIFIIDVNKTPFGPPFGLPDNQREEAIKRLTSTFREVFLNK